VTLPIFSVIIASQKRPDDLKTCLDSLSLQTNAPDFEIIVVGDNAAKGVCDDQPRSMIFLHEERQNISLLRNLGIKAASGRICAFIDDDAIAKPNWLHALHDGFAATGAAGGGGYVLERDGVTFQWTCRYINPDGTCSDFDAHAAKYVTAPNGLPLKIEGTNMAFTADALNQLGGFDEAYAFYMDETDLCFRAHKAGLNMALFPKAEVIHNFTRGPRRNADRTPTTLFDIGSSVQHFLNTHTNAAQHQNALDALRLHQKNRLLRWMVSGHLEPRDVRILLRTLEDGIGNGQNCDHQCHG